MLPAFIRQSLTLDAEALQRDGPILYVLRRTAAFFAAGILIIATRLALWRIIDWRFGSKVLWWYVLLAVALPGAALVANIVAVMRAKRKPG